jgi:hypothetical protein
VLGIVLLLLLLTSASLEPAVESPAVASARPSLTITTMNPLHVVGRGFKASERVVVSVGPRRRTATADRHGRFSVRFGRAMCSGGTILAVGSKGSRVAVRLPRTVCAAP